MHELSIAGAVVSTAERAAAGRPVSLVALRVGRLRQVVPDSLEFAFGLVSRGTVCEGARLEQSLVPARLACAPCAAEWEIETPDFRCPSCGAAGRPVSGEELEVEYIEISPASEEEEAACTRSG